MPLAGCQGLSPFPATPGLAAAGKLPSASKENGRLNPIPTAAVTADPINSRLVYFMVRVRLYVLDPFVILHFSSVFDTARIVASDSLDFRTKVHEPDLRRRTDDGILLESDVFR